MVPIECPDGHILVDEDTQILQVLMLESGKLVRTKFAVEETKKHAVRSSMNLFKDISMRSITFEEKSIVVDVIQGRGRITGLLHILEPGSKAFATVHASGPTKVWSISADDFREVISSDPQFALDMMGAMARELRTGSKSLRGLMKQVQKVGNGDMEGDSNFKICRVMCYDATSWVTDGFKPAIEAFNKEHESEGFSIVMDYTTDRLSEKSAVFAAGYDAVCLFVNDNANADVLQMLSRIGVKMVAMRCAGFDRVDTKAARAYGMTVARVPAYSPYAVAEMAISLLMAVNRKITKANNRVKMANFTLDSGLMGMDIYGKTVGVMGTGTSKKMVFFILLIVLNFYHFLLVTGKIGALLCNIVLGFGANLIWSVLNRHSLLSTFDLLTCSHPPFSVMMFLRMNL